FRKGDEAIIPAIMEKCFGSLELIPRVKYSVGGPYFSPEGSFIAEKNGEAVGCIGLVKLPHTNWFELRYLGIISDGLSSTADNLLDMSIQFAESQGVERLKASTPAVQPYFDLYKKKGFEPARRQLQVGWDLTKEPEGTVGPVQIKELEKDSAAEARRVWVASLRPYWDWWIEEYGGPESAGGWIEESVNDGDPWVGAFADGKLIGTTLLWPNAYGEGNARFNGVYVLPEMRNKGAGRALMQAAIIKGRELGQKKMNVRTVSFLDHLAPGAALYLRCGGRVETEFLELYRQ
ncbi:MAG TPA: GNAT family N-acetyltransferase, partial [Nitrososphaerales archaeon]|nr:GNAT family N-acetyltransferase [Nitrososphaerales archaeon]